MAADVIRDEVTLGTTAHDHAGMVTWTEDLILKQLWRHFAAQSWACVPQATVAMRDLPEQYQVPERLEDPDRRIDMLCVRRAKKPEHEPFESLAFEVKVTRQDFFEDVRNPAKQATWRQAATRHAFAVPAGLVGPDDVPEWAGLVWVKTPTVGGWADIEWIRRAPYREDHAPQPVGRVIHGLTHRLAAREAHARGWNALPEATLGAEDLRGRLHAAQKAAEKALRDLDRARGQTKAWKTAYGALNPAGHPCEWCSRPVKPLNPGVNGFGAWRHLDLADDEACGEAEIGLLEVTARAEWAAADPQERNRRLTMSHRRAPGGFDAAAETDEWRAFLPYSSGYAFKFRLRGATPANVLPDTIGAPQ